MKHRCNRVCVVCMTQTLFFPVEHMVWERFLVPALGALGINFVL